MIFDLVSFLLGALAGGVACAISAKTLGWFNKQTQSIEKKV
jgi:hypothetical protein